MDNDPRISWLVHGVHGVHGYKYARARERACFLYGLYTPI
jgi:hypothetical protein